MLGNVNLQQSFTLDHPSRQLGTFPFTTNPTIHPDLLQHSKSTNDRTAWDSGDIGLLGLTDLPKRNDPKVACIGGCPASDFMTFAAIRGAYFTIKSPELYWL